MIVFIALGSTPSHTREALVQARRANPDEPIVLLHQALSATVGALTPDHRVRLYDIAGLADDPRFAEFYRRRDTRDGFRSRFWRHTSGRFLALRAFMEREQIDVATHLENDVLLYAPIDTFKAWPPFCDPKLATVFEGASRAIPGIVHVGARSSLDAFADFVLGRDAAGPGDDMTRLAEFREARPDAVADLPTLPPASDVAAVTRSLFARSAPEIALPPAGWLFDGARFGQYLGGIDPRNAASRLQRWFGWQHGWLAHPNGFINESCLDDPSRYEYRVTTPMGLAAPTVVSGNREYPLATLHVHSKKLSRFTSEALARAGSASPRRGSA